MAEPKALGPVYDAALQSALDAAGADSDKFRHIAESYAKAVHRQVALHDHWVELGQPLMTEGGATGRAAVAHPLLERIERADAHALRFAEQLGLTPSSSKPGRGRGRPQEQVVPREGDEPPMIAPLRVVS